MKGEQENKIARALSAARIKFEREYKFHPTRKWRFDFAIPAKKIAIEFEGGIYLKKARHTSSTGYAKDVEKYNEAVLLGWKILRYTAKDLAVRNGEYKIIEDLQRLTNA
jgi:very-short-patch-repair endonuclease